MIGIICRCMWSGDRPELIINKDIEMYHPRNKGRIFISDPDYHKKAYYTTFELCPKCKRVIFADGHPINLISEDELKKKRR